MIGMNRQTGFPVSGLDHLRQSIADIITTPVGSRVMRRNYGCDLFRWVDAPTTGEFVARASAAILTAIKCWEPRITVDRVVVEPTTDGTVTIQLCGRITSTDVLYNQRLGVVL